MHIANEITGGRSDRLGHRSGDRRRVQTVLETFATAGSRGESLSEVAHDARNMVAALGLYCDLLEEPGVLAAPSSHYAQELRLIAAASRRLVEKLVALDAYPAPLVDFPGDSEEKSQLRSRLGDCAFDASIELKPQPEVSLSRHIGHTRRWDPLPPVPITNLAAELLANRNLLAALAGPGIALTVDTDGGSRPVRLTAEDLTRVLVNLVKNAAEAMPGGGRIRIGLCERRADERSDSKLVLAIEDNGPGIPPDGLQRIFTSGYTTRCRIETKNEKWPCLHRGLGLAIARAIVEAAGGSIAAANRKPRGARFEIELPVWKGSARPSVSSS